jgi:hypothetical protein
MTKDIKQMETNICAVTNPVLMPMATFSGDFFHLSFAIHYRLRRPAAAALSV